MDLKGMMDATCQLGDVGQSPSSVEDYRHGINYSSQFLHGWLIECSLIHHRILSLSLFA
jgi:hypothetical protein